MMTTIPHEGVASWQWVRIYYFERCKDSLIVDAVWPVLAERSMAFFRRDWQGGPNVLVGLEDTSSNAAALPGGIASIQRYLRDRPSTSAFDIDQYRKQVSVCAAWEARDADAENELRPNNTVFVGGGPPSRPGMVSEHLRQAEYRFLCRSAPFVARWLAAIREGVGRDRIAMQILIVVLWIVCPTTLRPAASFQSHSNGLISRFGLGKAESSPLYQMLEARYARSRDRLTQTMKEVIAKLNAGEDVFAGGTEFVDMMRDTICTVVRELRLGRYSSVALSAPASTSSGRVAQQALQEHVEFSAWQISINLTYLMLNQLGVTTLERLWGCHSTFRAIEDVFGESLRYLSWEPARELPFLSACANEPLHEVINR